MRELRPIGVLDSGFGGLSTVEAIQELLPQEGIIYFGDNAFAPYGKRSEELVRERVVKIIDFLLSEKAKLVVIACNTATVVGIDYYRERFPSVPIVGLVPVVKTAAAEAKNGKFVILATSRTVESSYQRQLIERFAGGCEVHQIEADQIVEMIERGDLKAAERLAKNLLKKEAGGGVLVLGCTHFVFLKEFLMKEGWQVLDSGGAVARQVKRILENNRILGKGQTVKYFTSGEAEKFREIAEKLLKRKITNIEQKVL